MTDKLLTKQQALEAIENAAQRELARIHGKRSVDYVLGYQLCAKAIVNAVDVSWPAERK